MWSLKNLLLLRLVFRPPHHPGLERLAQRLAGGEADMPRSLAGSNDLDADAEALHVIRFEPSSQDSNRLRLGLGNPG
jgi:hypothetical protein